MDWTEVQDALLAATPTSPRELLTIEKRGVYAWWDLNATLALFWPLGFPSVEPAKPLYVGSASTTLMERGGEMHLGNECRWSTIRRSLAALLVDELNLLPGLTIDRRQAAKFYLAPENEQRLTDWMVTNLEVTWVLLPTIGDIEKNIIKKLTPPLNYFHATKGP